MPRAFLLVICIKCLLIVSYFDGVRGYHVFYIAETCARVTSADIRLEAVGSNSSGILKASKTNAFLSGKHCTITLIPRILYGVVISVKLIDMQPWSQDASQCENYIEIATEKGKVRLCGYSNDELEFQSYINWGPTEIVFHTSNRTSNSTNNNAVTQFQITFTAARKGRECYADEIHCLNDRCIWNGHKCNGHNNCGDLTDEAANDKI